MAEIGDKTQLVAFSLTSSTRRPAAIFLASSLALVLSAVIAALLGGAALRLIPGYIKYASAALFIVFGLVILFTRETPRIKEGFLQAVLLENAIIKALPGLMEDVGGKPAAGGGTTDARAAGLREITQEDRSHADAFRVLVREKKLFRDDINQDPELRQHIERLRYPRNLRKLPPADRIRRILELEDAGIAFLRFLHAHLDAAHHDEPDLQEALAVLVEEEGHHQAILRALEKEL